MWTCPLRAKILYWIDMMYLIIEKNKRHQKQSRICFFFSTQLPNAFTGCNRIRFYAYLIVMYPANLCHAVFVVVSVGHLFLCTLSFGMSIFFLIVLYFFLFIFNIHIAFLKEYVLGLNIIWIIFLWIETCPDEMHHNFKIHYY